MRNAESLFSGDEAFGWEGWNRYFATDALCPSPDSVAACAVADDGRLGLYGELPAYGMRCDTGVIALLLVGLLGMVLIVANGKRFLIGLFKDFFFSSSHAQGSFGVMKTGRELRYILFLVVQTGCLYGLLYNYRMGDFHVQFSGFGNYSPILGIRMSVCLLYLYAKYLLYGFVNSIFYDKMKYREWKNSYLFILSLEGVLLYPLVFISVFYELPVRNAAFSFVMLHIFAVILLFYKSFAIFFRESHGLLRLIVYFCALEIAPVFVFVQILAYVNEVIITKL